MMAVSSRFQSVVDKLGPHFFLNIHNSVSAITIFCGMCFREHICNGVRIQSVSTTETQPITPVNVFCTREILETMWKNINDFHLMTKVSQNVINGITKRIFSYWIWLLVQTKDLPLAGLVPQTRDIPSIFMVISAGARSSITDISPVRMRSSGCSRWVDVIVFMVSYNYRRLWGWVTIILNVFVRRC